MLRKARKLLHLLPNPVFRRGLNHGVGAAIEHRPLLHGIDVRTVIDVGANKGQYVLLCRSLFPMAKIIALEPIAGPFATLCRVANGDNATTVHQIAAGNKDGETTINVHRLDIGASFLPLGSDKTGEQQITVRRLDTLLAPQDIEPDALLKLDVQGFEDRVISGAAGIIDRFRYVVCEVGFFPTLDGQVTAHEIIQQLHGHGFRLSGANEVKTINGRPAWCDMLFERH